MFKCNQYKRKLSSFRGNPHNCKTAFPIVSILIVNMIFLVNLIFIHLKTIFYGTLIIIKLNINKS